MRAPVETSADIIPDRRKRGRRAVDYSGDLDSAFTDGARPRPLSVSSGIRLYGSIVWIVVTSAIGSFLLLKAGWMYFKHVLGYP